MNKEKSLNNAIPYNVINFICFYKQCQAETGKKSRKKLSNSPRLNVCYLKFIQLLHPRYHPKIMENIIKYKQTTSTSV